MDIDQWNKYLSPQNIKYLYHNKKNIESIIKYIKSPKNKLLVVVGNCGSGKTHIINVITKELKISCTTIYLSQEECFKKMVEKLKKINYSSSINFYLNKTNNNKIIIVLDEIEYCNIYDKKYVIDVVNFYTKLNIPIILICNEKYNKIIESVSNISVNITISSPSIEKNKKYIKGNFLLIKLKIQ